MLTLAAPSNFGLKKASQWERSSLIKRAQNLDPVLTIESLDTLISFGVDWVGVPLTDTNLSSRFKGFWLGDMSDDWQGSSVNADLYSMQLFLPLNS